MSEKDPTDRDATGEIAIDGVGIEPGTPDDRMDVLRVLDAAMLETDAETIGERIDAGDVLVARFERTGAVVGALVATRPAPERETADVGVDPGDRLHVDAVAVRRARRGRGVGSALVATTVERAEDDPEIARVSAVFDASLATFYTDLGFETRPVSEATPTDETEPTGDTRRFRGRRSVTDPS